MAGVKGRSGRRTKRYSSVIDEVVDGSIRLIRQYITDESVPIKDRAEVASRFALKYMPQKVEQTLSIINISDSTINKLMEFMQRHGNHENNMQIPHNESDNNYIDVEVIEPKSNDTNELVQ